jgi:hypothetical protein
MTFTLKRSRSGPTGIFGTLKGNGIQFSTLEHGFESYDDPPGEPKYAPIIPPGLYECVLGMHQLKDLADPFLTYEVTGVPGHSGILFHVGNYNADSEGCVLLGLSADENMIYGSRRAFEKFMELLDGEDSFTLVVG